MWRATKPMFVWCVSNAYVPVGGSWCPLTVRVSIVLAILHTPCNRGHPAGGPLDSLNSPKFLRIPKYLRNLDLASRVAGGVNPHADIDEPICEHFQRAAELIARRWMPLVIHALKPGPRRYADLKAAVGGISDAVLSDRLRNLETAGIVVRTVEPSTPVRVSYALTASGEELAGALDELKAWAERWAAEPTAAGAGGV
jgi:DNA-binding HxlR family transcriptional regulator